MSAEAKSGRLDVAKVRADFPILKTSVRGKPLVYLDNTSTTQRPQCVLDAMDDYYTRYNSNVHRGLYAISEEATAKYEAVRKTVARLLRVDEPSRVVFVRGCTEAINLAAYSYLAPRLQAGDEILVTEMEHHSNIVPWQLVAAAAGAKVIAVPMTAAGELDLVAFGKLLNDRTKMVAFTHVSNAIGTVNPAAKITAMAKAKGAAVLIDGAQAVPHLAVDVDALGADFYAFSGHKMLGPTGIGVLCGRSELLAEMQPWQGGGDMIREVSFDGTTFADPPQRFEAGTPNVAGVIGFGAAIEYLLGLGFDAIAEHEATISTYARERLASIDGVKIFGGAAEQAAVISFVLEGEQSSDVATLLDQEGIAVRSGHHCAQPLMRHFGVSSTIRASFGPYNDHGDVDRLADALIKVRRVLKG